MLDDKMIVVDYSSNQENSQESTMKQVNKYNSAF